MGNTPSYSISTSSPSVYNSYKPFDFSQPLKPFTAFTSGNQAAEKVSDPIAQKYNIEQDSPVVGIIETEGDQKSETDDGEVFYIFYENEKLQQGPQKIGQSLQRFIQDDFTAASDNVYSDTNVEEIINIDAAQNAKFPNFAQIQEVEKPEPELPLFYDVPIKIEETNPYDVRTINVPDGFVAGERGIDGSDIERPVSIGFNQEIQDENILFEDVGTKVLRKVRKPKPRTTHGSDKSYFGSRLQPLEHYDIV